MKDLELRTFTRRRAWGAQVRFLHLAGVIALTAAAAASQAPSGTASLSGTVVSDETNSRVLAGVIVTVSGNSFQPRTAISDDQGQFAFRGLPAGSLTLDAVKPGYVSTRYGQKRPGRGAGVVLSLDAAQELNGLIVRMPLGAAITGTITDEVGRPLRNMTVSVFESRVVSGARRLIPVPSLGTGEPAHPSSDDRGVYRVADLPPGDYVVSATNLAAISSTSTSARTPGQRLGPATVYYPGTPHASEALVVTLGRGDERRDVNFVVRFVPAFRAEGRVVSPDGQAVAGVQVTARSIVSIHRSGAILGPTSTRSSADGTFSIGNLASGAYRVLARSEPGRATGPSAGLWAAADISVNAEDVSGLTLVLQPGLTVTGRIVFNGAGMLRPDLTSSPVTLVLSPVDDGSPLPGAPTAQINPDGTFAISRIIPGRYRLTSPEPERADSAEDSAGASRRWVLHSSTLDGRDIADLPFEIVDRNLSGAVVTLSPRLAEISGKLVDAAGRPTPDYFVVVFSTNRDHWIEGSRRVPKPVRPSSTGAYRFESLAAGTYYLAALTDVDPEELFDHAFLEQVAAGAVTIQLAEGQTRTQDLKLAGVQH